MIIELRKKSQITLPSEVVKKLNLQEGDKFEVFVENGVIRLEPVVVYSKQYVTKLAREIQLLREDTEGKYTTFDTIDALMESLNDGE